MKTAAALLLLQIATFDILDYRLYLKLSNLFLFGFYKEHILHATLFKKFDHTCKKIVCPPPFLSLFKHLLYIMSNPSFHFILKVLSLPNAF